MNSVTVNPRNSQHLVRNENGQFASVITSERALRQEAINQNLAHWQWLNDHGYAGVQPFEVFSAPGR